jgi:hypothetical protein
VQPLLQGKSNNYYIFWVCVYDLSFPACNAYAPFLWPVRRYSIFPLYLINGTILKKRLLDLKRVLILSTTAVWNISHSKGKWASYDKKNVYWSSCKVVFFQILMELEFSRQIFEKYTNIKFHENPPNRSRVFPCGWTGGHTDMRKLVVAFRNIANVPKNFYITLLLESFFLKNLSDNESVRNW